jgi:hypothetical protein
MPLDMSEAIGGELLDSGVQRIHDIHTMEEAACGHW